MLTPCFLPVPSLALFVSVTSLIHKKVIQLVINLIKISKVCRDKQSKGRMKVTLPAVSNPQDNNFSSTVCGSCFPKSLLLGYNMYPTVHPAPMNLLINYFCLKLK